MNHLQRMLLAFASIALVGLIPLFVTDPAVLDLAVLTGYYLLLSASWNLLAGFSGQYSFAHVSLAVVGAYASVFLTNSGHVPALWTIPLAGLATAITGVALGMVCLRTRGIYLSLITFAFAGAFVVWVTGDYTLTGGDNGLISTIFFQGTSRGPFVWLAFGLVIVYFAAQSFIVRSRLGLFAMALRDDEDVAEGLGVKTRQVRVLVFGYTAFWAGVAGSLYAGYEGIVTPSMGALTEMGLVLSMVIVGGIGHRFGPIVGTVILQAIAYEVRDFGQEYTILIFSSIVVAVMLIARDGIVGLCERLLARVRPARARWSSPRLSQAAGVGSTTETEQEH